MDAEVDGCQQAVVHEDEIAPVRVEMTTWRCGSKNATSPSKTKRLQAVASEEALDLPDRGGDAGDSGLPDQGAEFSSNFLGSDEAHIIAKQLVVKPPPFEMIDGGCLGFLMGSVNDEQPEKAGPCGSEEAVGPFQKRNLMFVSLIVGRAAQRDWRTGKEVFVLPGAFAENSEFFDKIGRTALKTRNCFTAASEVVDKCLERDSRSKVIWFMGGHSLE